MCTRTGPCIHRAVLLCFFLQCKMVKPVICPKETQFIVLKCIQMLHISQSNVAHLLTFSDNVAVINKKGCC